MTELGSVGVAELMVILCVCCVPIIVVVGAVIGVLVFMGRRKPKPAPQRVAPQQAVPAPKAKPPVDLETKAPAGAKAVTVSDVATRSCPSCGADNPVDNAFCEYCGASLAGE